MKLSIQNHRITADDRNKVPHSVNTGLEPIRCTVQLTLDRKAGDDGYHTDTAPRTQWWNSMASGFYVLATNKMGNFIVVDGCRQMRYNRPVCIGRIQFTTDRLHIADREDSHFAVDRLQRIARMVFANKTHTQTNRVITHIRHNIRPQKMIGVVSDHTLFSATIAYPKQQAVLAVLDRSFTAFLHLNPP